MTRDAPGKGIKPGEQPGWGHSEYRAAAVGTIMDSCAVEIAVAALYQPVARTKPIGPGPVKQGRQSARGGYLKERTIISIRATRTGYAIETAIVALDQPRSRSSAIVAAEAVHGSECAVAQHLEHGPV